MPEYDINSGGKRYRVEADNYNDAMGAVTTDQINSGGVGMFLIGGILAVIFAIVAFIVIGVKTLIALVTALPLLLIPAVAAIFSLSVLPRFIPGVNKVKILRVLVGLAAAVAICWFGFPGIIRFYQNSNKILPSPYSADYIQALSDGSSPVLYGKRFKKGEELVSLTVGEKVEVAGNSLDLTEFKITTAAGLTGWVEAAAFPEKSTANITIAAGERTVADRVDRDTERLRNKYLGLLEDRLVFKPEAGKAIKVSAETPLYFAGRDLRLEEIPADGIFGGRYGSNANTEPGTQMLVLESIVYAEDCTIILLKAENPRMTFSDLYGQDNPPAWRQSLTVTDLDSGETWPVMPADFYQASHSINNTEPYVTWQAFFFPSFKSRHFSLTHRAPALPKKKQSWLMGKIMGKVSGYYSWDFPEVRVR
jgi:hypothetical protein